MSRRSPGSRVGADTGRRLDSRARRRSRRSPTSCAGNSLPPRGLSPAGIVLVDKPAGPSSFAIVAELRRKTGARTGHAGTLDPFATGLLLLLSGSATKLARCFVGLDKRYLTDVDLTGRTTTGDPEGRVLERHDPPASEELERRLEGLRGEVELPIPAASAVKIGGERAYKLARPGRGASRRNAGDRGDLLAAPTARAGKPRRAALDARAPPRAPRRGRGGRDARRRVHA